jgi:hypothetical protein
VPTRLGDKTGTHDLERKTMTLSVGNSIPVFKAQSGFSFDLALWHFAEKKNEMSERTTSKSA